MDSFELNKIIGAVLGTLLFVMGIGFLAEAIYSPIEDRGPGLSLAEPAAAEHGATDAPAEVVVPLGTLLAAASVEDGTAATRKCTSCHTFEEGGSNKAGPNLYGVVGRPIASHEGFAYSAALTALGAAGETWTYEHLDAFIHKPSAFAPDTKMTFGGVPTAEERANILVFLASLAASPMPFPAVEEAPAEEAAPADEAAPTEAAPTAEAAPAEEATPAEDAAPTETAPAAEATETAPVTETPVEAPAETPATETPTTPATETPATDTPATEAPAETPATETSTQ